MYIVPIAWLYVALMMAIAEATNSNGSLLGAIVTFVMYGLAPVLLVLYLMATPARKRAIRAREAGLAGEAACSTQPDSSSHTPAAAQGLVVTPVRKEP